MKKLLFLMSAMLVLTLTSFGQTFKALDEKYGFRDMKFEMPLSSFKDLVKLDPNYDVYGFVKENLKLGEYNLTSVDYTFYKNQLSSINITISGDVNRKGILKIFQLAYGNGKKDEYMDEYTWSGEKILMFYMEYNAGAPISPDGSEGAMIIINCIKLSDKESADKKESNSEAAKKL
jgi:hypothetical protein